MAKQLGGTKNSTPIRDPNDNDEKMEAAANAAQTAIVNANRPYYAITEGAAKAGAPNTKADGKAVGQAFNPCRS